MALQAGASGLPFTPVPGLIGSDLMTVRPDFRIIDDPYVQGMRIAIVPAITPDIALVHALCADLDGNLVVSASGDDPLLIRASRTVIATTEAIVSSPVTSIGACEQIVPGIYVDVVAPAPRGSHPLACPGRYERDAAHLAAYVQAARDPAAFAAYLRRYVFEPAGYDEYAQRLVTAAVGV